MSMMELNVIRNINAEFETNMDMVFDHDIVNYVMNIGFQKNDNNFLTEISYLTNTKKKLYFKYLLYRHPQLSLLFISQFHFENKNEALNKDYFNNSFCIRDYTTFRNIPFKKELLRCSIMGYEESVLVAKELFNIVKQILLTDEMQRILFTDYWINIPFDYSQIGR
jgi:hypothetical protein